MFLQGQISLPLSIYSIFTGSNHSSFFDLRYFYGANRSPSFRLTRFLQGQTIFLSSYSKFTWWGKTEIFIFIFILQTPSCKLEFIKHVTCILQGVVSFLHVPVYFQLFQCTQRLFLSCEKNFISNLHVVDMPLSYPILIFFTMQFYHHRLVEFPTKPKQS